MYKITKTGDNFSSYKITDGINPNSIRNWTYLQIEIANCQNCNNVYFQEDLPRDSEGNIANSLYWKVDNGIVIEMTDDEKLAVDTEIENKRINDYFKEKKYKVTIDSLDEFIKTQYQPYIAYCKERSSILTESITVGEGATQTTKSFVYLDYIKGEEFDETSAEFAKSDMAMIKYATYTNGEKIFKLEINQLKESNLQVIIEE